MNISNFKFTAMACAVAALFMFSSCTAEPQEKKIGIQLYTVMNAMKADPYGSIDKLAEMGYKSFELVQWAETQRFSASR